ncbi:hypothetical protein BV25DRAFT_1674783 [Artomyces pyxidatus]|uniref:Uncharacterized protein n=1 Tax=Artomyces pyxidatus TaxID=48021 RepID=A0ACB8TA20_9AGAM|nr:hypothetical protein BV25DRAFT_1674783 [Artomyces pyxidatus]
MMPPFKTIRCRYFDERGRPLKPYCLQGERCSFIHPEDSNWATGAPNKVPPLGRPSKVGPRTSSSAEPRRLDNRGRRVEPLADQSTLFKRVNEDDDFDRPYDRERERSRDYDLSSSKYSPSRPYDRDHSKFRDDRNHSVPDKVIHKPAYTRPDDGSRHSKDPNQRYYRDHQDRVYRAEDSKKRAAEHPRQIMRDDERENDRHDLPSVLLSPSSTMVAQREGKKSVETIVELFRNVAKITNQATLDSAAFDKEDEKLQIYTELSDSLAKISPSAASAIGPTLANVIANHAKYRERVEADFKRLSRAWEDIFESFIQGVVHALDVQLETGLVRLRDEIRYRVAEEVTHIPRDHYPSANSGPAVTKRKWDSPDRSRRGEDTRGDISNSLSGSSQAVVAQNSEDDQECKRRRLRDSTVTSDTLDRMGVDLSQDVLSVLEGVKSTLDRQSEARHRSAEKSNQLSSKTAVADTGERGFASATLSSRTSEDSVGSVSVSHVGPGHYP